MSSPPPSSPSDKPSNQSSFPDVKPAPEGTPGHTRAHPSRDLTSEEKARVAETRKAWQVRETVKPVDPKSLIERLGITFEPHTFTREAFEKLQALCLEKLVQMEADQRQQAAEKDAAVEKVGALELQIEQLKLSASRADETAAELSACKATTAIQLASLQEKLDFATTKAQASTIAFEALKAQSNADRLELQKLLADAQALSTERLLAAQRESEAQNERLREQLAAAQASIAALKAQADAQVAAAQSTIDKLKSDLAAAMESSRVSPITPRPTAERAAPRPSAAPKGRSPQTVPRQLRTTPVKPPALPAGPKVTSNRRVSDVPVRRAASPIKMRTVEPAPGTVFSPTSASGSTPRSQSAARTRRPTTTAVDLTDTRPPWRFYAGPSVPADQLIDDEERLQ